MHPPAELPAEAPPVSVEEERKLLRFYESKVANICIELRLPKKVQVRSAALVYIRSVGQAM